MRQFIIVVDFDGTCVEHEFPLVGPDVPGAVYWLQRFHAEGASLILWTMRSTIYKNPAPHLTEQVSVLQEAVQWFHDHSLPLFGVNENPYQSKWTSSPKVYGHIYIDDAAVGCPLLPSSRPCGKPYVDWDRVGPIVLDKFWKAQQ